jgi:quinol monooxygenase YgiN
MVITVLEAHVAQDQWETLKRAFQEGASNLPPQMNETFLMQNTADPTLWQALSCWKSREALDEYRRSVQTPGGILFFRAAGAEPKITIYEVAAHVTH